MSPPAPKAPWGCRGALTRRTRSDLTPRWKGRDCFPVRATGFSGQRKRCAIPIGRSIGSWDPGNAGTANKFAAIEPGTAALRVKLPSSPPTLTVCKQKAKASKTYCQNSMIPGDTVNIRGRSNTADSSQVLLVSIPPSPPNQVSNRLTCRLEFRVFWERVATLRSRDRRRDSYSPGD